MTEATLREQANLLNLTHDAIVVCDMNGPSSTGTAAQRNCTDGQRSKRVQSHWRVAQDDLPGTPRADSGRSYRCRPLEGELVQTKKDGSQVVVASRWSLQRDERSAPVAILVTNNDITKRKRAEGLPARAKGARDFVNAVRRLSGALCLMAPSILSMSFGWSSQVYHRRMHRDVIGKPGSSQ